MTVDTTTPVVIPAFLTSLITNYAQKGLTALFVYLVAHGVIMSSDKTAFLQVGVGLALGAVSLVWTYVKTQLDHQKQQQLAAAPPGSVVAK